MGKSHTQIIGSQILKVLEDFVECSNGIELNLSEENVEICQREDAKRIHFRRRELKEVLVRQDKLGSDFLQLNFSDGKKILLTENLVGFKPSFVAGVDYSKLPNVVTTPDMVSVFEAIEEALRSNEPEDEMNNLKRIFQAILEGGEAVGFDMENEKLWLLRVCPSNTISA